MTQSSVAISGNDKEWVVVNASPDLGFQIEQFPPLHPAASQLRSSPLRVFCLTNSDLDHVLGLVGLRQGQDPLSVYASESIRREVAWIEKVLQPFRPLEWREPGRSFQLIASALEMRVIDLGKSVGYAFRNPDSSATLLVAPALASFDASVQEAIEGADTVLLDGTFWSDDELKPFRPDARSARQMGHVPVQETFRLFAPVPARHKIYIHINNTNPILTPGSPQRREVEEAGIVIGFDGLEFEL